MRGVFGSDIIYKSKICQNKQLNLFQRSMLIGALWTTGGREPYNINPPFTENNRPVCRHWKPGNDAQIDNIRKELYTLVKKKNAYVKQTWNETLQRN